MEFENQRLAQSMVRLFMGYIPTRVIYAAAKLELADHIGADGATAQDLAAELKVDAAAVHRLMRVLAGLGVLRQDNGDRFYVTPFGETLRKDSPQSVRDYAIYSHEFVYDAFRSVTECIRTGRPAIDDFFSFLRADPQGEAVFHAGMSNRGRIETQPSSMPTNFLNRKRLWTSVAATAVSYQRSWRPMKKSWRCWSISRRRSRQQKRDAGVLCPDASWLHKISLRASRLMVILTF